jgi:hypothetical protein
VPAMSISISISISAIIYNADWKKEKKIRRILRLAPKIQPANSQYLVMLTAFKLIF